MVVVRRLLEHCFVERHQRILAFDEHERLARPVENEQVGAFGQAVVCQAAFGLDQRLGITVPVQQKMHEMLPHPFLGGEENVFAAQHVKNVQLFLFADYLIVVGGQVELEHTWFSPQTAANVLWLCAGREIEFRLPETAAG